MIRISDAALALGIVLATVAVGEVAARVADWQPAPEADVGDVRYGYSPTGQGDYHPSQDGVYITQRAHPFYVHTNAAGFRNRRELREDAYRILALGDSQTFGLFVNSQDTWTDWLEYDLDTALKVPVEVLNNGIPGGTISDELEYFVQKGAALQARLVVLCAYANDVTDLRHAVSGRAAGLNVETQVAFSDLRWFLGRHSALYQFARSVKDWLTRSRIEQSNRAIVEDAARRGALPPQVLDPGLVVAETPALKDRYAQLFAELARRVQDSGAQLLVAYLPSSAYGGADSHDPDTAAFIRDLAGRHHVSFVDLTPAIASRPADEIFLTRHADPGYPADSHMSRSGHIVVAAELARVISGLAGPSAK